MRPKRSRLVIVGVAVAAVAAALAWVAFSGQAPVTTAVAVQVQERTSSACQDLLDQGGTASQVSMSAVWRGPGLSIGVAGSLDGDGAISLYPAPDGPQASQSAASLALHLGERATVFDRTVCLMRVSPNPGNLLPGGGGHITLVVR